MSQLKSTKLEPNQALIYERADGVVYARYRDPPHNTVPRWIVGGDPGAVARAQGRLCDYSEWLEMTDMCAESPTLMKLMDKLVTTYYMMKGNK